MRGWLAGVGESGGAIMTDHQRIERFAAVIAQIERYEKVYGWARSLSGHMRDLPQPGNYQLHDMFREQRNMFDAEALGILRALRKDGWCCQFTVSEQRWDLLEAIADLA